MRSWSFFSSSTLAGVMALYPALSVSNALNLLSNPPPSTGALTIAYAATQAIYNKAGVYYTAHSNTCAPVDHFLKQPGAGNVIASITNDKKRCAIVLCFSQSAPGPLQGKCIAQLPQKNGSTIDFDLPHRVTNIDFGPRKQSLFSQSQKPFAYSSTPQNGPWGNVPCTTLNNILTATSALIIANETAANSTSSSSSDDASTSAGGATRTSKIATI